MKIVTYDGLARYHSRCRAGFVGNDAFDAYKAETAGALAHINDSVEALTGLEGSGFLGIFGDAESLRAALPDGQMAGWGLVGADLSSLHLHTTHTGNGGWQEWPQDYDFTDFADVKASLAGLSLSTPMSEEEWDALTSDGTSTANLKPDTIYMVYEV